MTVKTMAKVLELKQLAGFQAEDQIGRAHV